jgi:hypothetical protein
MTLAIVVGGAECVWDDLAEVRAMCTEHNVAYTLYVCNDMIELFPEVAIGVTLHVDKIQRWMANRAAKGYPNLTHIWAHRHHHLIFRHTHDWGGSVGLFGVKVAREAGHDKVVICGVPMDMDANHFVRHQRWGQCLPFRGAWNRHKVELAPYLRSMSGWTAEQFGKVELEWLKGAVP